MHILNLNLQEIVIKQQGINTNLPANPSMTKRNNTGTKVKYNRHISFDDLSPSFVDEEIRLIKDNHRHVGFNNKYIHIPPQYNPLYGQKRPSIKDQPTTKSSVEISHFKFDNTRNDNHNNQNLYTKGVVSQQRSRSESPFGGRHSSNNNTMTTDGKKQYDLTKRLPPPPSRSSLKKTTREPDEQDHIEDIDISNMDLDTEEVMTEETNDNTQLNSGSKYGYTQSLFANLNEVEDRVAKGKLTSQSNATSTNNNNSDNNNKSRKKSFANMTNEELAELENFYVSKGRSTKSNIENYDFTQKNTIFSNPDLYNSKTSAENRLAQANKEIADTLAVTYPSRPVVDHRAISMTVQNSQFRSFVTSFQKKVPIKDQKERRSSLRVINCYISGRRYTWSSVDWYVENLAKDGDHLIIVTSIPNFEAKIDNILYIERRQKKKVETINKIMGVDYHHHPHSNTNSKTNSRSNSNDNINSNNDNDNDMTFNNTIRNKDLPLSKGVRLEAIYKEARDATRSILEYYAGRLQNKIVKITVELVKTDSTKDAITKSAVLYKPHAQVVSTVSTNIQIKFRNGNVKLPFFMMKYYPMPAFIVPFEFIHPKKLTEECNTVEKKVTRSNRLSWLDETIHQTLYNPFISGHPHSDSHQHEENEQVRDSDGETDDESVTSVNDYFPMDPKVQKNITLFEELGYVIPKTSREILLRGSDDIVFDKDGKRLTPITSRSSRRSSRVQLGGSTSSLYKVKSLIVDDVASGHTVDSEVTSNSSSSIRKTKSVGSPSQRLSPMSSHGNKINIGKKSSNTPLTKYKTFDPATSKKKSHHSHHRLSPVQHTNSNSTSSLSHHSSNSLKKKVPIKTSSLSSKEKDKKKKKSGFGSMFSSFFK